MRREVLVRTEERKGRDQEGNVHQPRKLSSVDFKSEQRTSGLSGQKGTTPRNAGVAGKGTGA
jgi:hypothetical protein